MSSLALNHGNIEQSPLDYITTMNLILFHHSKGVRKQFAFRIRVLREHDVSTIRTSLLARLHVRLSVIRLVDC